MGVKTKITKNIYVVCKGIACGMPAGALCFRTAKQCIKDITLEDLPSRACYIFLVSCVPTSASVAFVGAFCTPETLKKIKKGLKVAVNIGALIYTGPAHFTDTALSSFEQAIFGEPLPVLSSGLLLLN